MMADWFASPANWVFLALAILTAYAGFKVVTTHNLIHAALALAGALGGIAGLFVLLSAEFVALTIILVYVGAVVVLFLFGIMITRAPIGREVSLDNERRTPAAVVAILLFLTLAGTSIAAFGDVEIEGLGDPISTELLGQSLLGRFVIPFEVVGFVLLAALIGGIAVARRDATPLEAEEREASR